MFNYLNKKKGQFSPFRVWIRPKWDELLTDYKMQEQFEKNMEEEKASQAQNQLVRFDVFKEGISFTVLKCDEDNNLIYNNNHHSFHTEVNFREKIERIRFPIDSHLTYSPDLFVKWSFDGSGYVLGITTPESFKKVFIVGDDKDLINITTIPYGLFGIGRLLKPEQVEGQLKKYGWILEEVNLVDTCMGRPLEIKHKYFTIYYDLI